MASKAPPPPPGSKGPSVIRIPPLHYLHILDGNKNVTRVEIGPSTYTRPEHEAVVEGPTKMILIPPRHYLSISNPVIRSKEGQPVQESSGAYKLRYGDEEIRFEQPPFPLYPGEVLSKQGVSPLQVVQADCALRLRAIRDFTDADGTERTAGDEWQFLGPATYVPRVEVVVVEVAKAIVVHENTALKLRARQNFGKRKAGEEWLHKEVGAYLPGVHEEVLGVIRATVLTEKKALQLRALHEFTDARGVARRAGDEWLVTFADASTHIPDVHEEVVGDVAVTSLSSRQYCVILDPVNAKTGQREFGKRKLVTGEAVFFLRPGERLEKGIQNVIVLGEDEALLLSAICDFVAADGKKVLAGSRWMVHGPRDFTPSIEMNVIEKRRTIPLHESEGIYVRDVKTGHVRAVIGESYMLKANEELWKKPVSPDVEQLLSKQGRDQRQKEKEVARDATRVVSYRAPHNSAVQVYDYKRNVARVVFGPELVLLQPDEEFTVLSLSGGTPKESDKIKSIALLLGPDFMTDVTIVETSDHARLSLKLAYNWHFDVEEAQSGKGPEAARLRDALFAVRDFVGDTCKAVASLVRASVASTTFDDFHRHSARIIRSAVFGIDKATGKVLDKLVFTANRLVITNIDIQSVEPVDQRTRDALQKSVQLAIEITTKSQEATARHEAERLAQEAKGRLERQRIMDEAEAEKKRKELVGLQAESAVVESTGQAIAEAKARAEASEIEGTASVKQAELKAKAARLRAKAELDSLRARQTQEVANQTAMVSLEVEKVRKLADVEAAKFEAMVKAVGRETIVAMATAGEEQNAKLLQGLGLTSVMITDGASPVNLFGTANGLIGGAGFGAAKPDLD